MRRLGRSAAGLCAVLAACLVATGTAAAADLMAKVRQTHTIVIGTSNDAPLSYVDPQTKEAAGVLPDVLREFFNREQIAAKIEVVAMPFASLIPSVQSGRIDLMGDAMYIRPARAQVMDFTDIIFYNPESLDVPKGNPLNLHSLADLCGHSAGSYEGTTLYRPAEEGGGGVPGRQGARGETVSDHPERIRRSRGRAAGCGGGGFHIVGIRTEAESQRSVSSWSGTTSPRTRKRPDAPSRWTKNDAAFVSEFNKQYAAMLADGTAAKLFTKWGL